MTWWRMAGIAGGVGVAGLLAVAYSTFGAFLPWREAAEAERLADALGVRVGSTIADVGAGGGRFTERLARRVGAQGRVYSTEIDEANRETIRRRIERAGLDNVTILEGAETSTNLPEACCEAVLLRNVYHHIGDPDAFARSLGRALKPGGRLAVIDFEPGALWFHGGRPSGASERRAGHGVDRAQVKEEMTAAGLTLVREVPEWVGPMWLMVFAAPSSEAPTRASVQRTYSSSPMCCDR